MPLPFWKLYSMQSILLDFYYIVSAYDVLTKHCYLKSYGVGFRGGKKGRKWKKKDERLAENLAKNVNWLNLLLSQLSSGKLPCKRFIILFMGAASCGFWCNSKEKLEEL